MTFRVTYSVLNADMTELNRAFDEAVTQFKGELGRAYPSRIMGQNFESGIFLEDKNPAKTSQVLAKFHRVSAPKVAEVIAYAKKAQKEWGRTPWAKRAEIIRKAADLISRDRLKISVAMALETGKNRLEALGDVEESADLFRYYAGQLEEAKGFDRPLGSLSPNESTRSVLKPFGVFAVISPFNFPLALSAGMSGGALLGGNAVILKPSQETPWCAEFLYQVLKEAGLPDGVFQVMHGLGSELGPALYGSAELDGLVFTGSKKVGLEIYHHFSKDYVRPCFLELGGKNPCYVCSSADLEKAVEGVARSAYGLSGQKCSALSRVYVHSSVYKEFSERLVERIKKIKIGDPLEVDVYMGPVINEAAFKRYQNAATLGKKDGKFLTGGNDLRLENKNFADGYFVPPSLLEIADGHSLSRDELFLPFLTLHKFDQLSKAIEAGNSSEYGLTAGVFTQDKTELDYYLDNAESGVLYANRQSGATTGAWPGINSFCGWKGSGSSGKGGCGPYYVSQFMREQSQTVML